MWAVSLATPAAAGICTTDPTTTPGTTIVTCPVGVGLGVPGDNTAGLSFSTFAGDGGGANGGLGGGNGGAGKAMDIASQTSVTTYG